MTPTLVTHGPVTCLNVTGLGEPGGAEYGSAVAALFAVAAALDSPPAMLEGRWWVEDERPPFEVPREQWRWHLMLNLPAAPAPGAVERARLRARPASAAVERVQVVTYTEGECVEALHEGPFSTEYVTLKLMEEFMTEHGLEVAGPHHELYLTPPDAAEPRTLLRQPVVPR